LLIAERGELQQAFQYFEVAIRHGSPFEAFHLLAQIHATTARLPAHAGGEKGHCGVSVAYYKLVSERGSWQDSLISDGDRAWARGDEETAFVKWLIAAETGSEVGQNNVAFLLDQGKGGDLFHSGRQQIMESDKAPKSAGKQQDTALSMRYWIRSAAQDNVDAMVKVGDLYCELTLPARVMKSENSRQTPGWSTTHMPRHSRSLRTTIRPPRTRRHPPWRTGTWGICTRRVKAFRGTGTLPSGTMT